MCARGLCSTTCVGGCKTGCTGCSNRCSKTCTGRCNAVCKSTCASNCTGGCSGSCQGNCGGSCSSGCGGSCSGRCSGCSGTCGGSCSGTSAGTSYGVFDWTTGHAPVKDETISILAEDWNRLADLIQAKTGVNLQSAKVKVDEVFTAAKYNMLADALGITNVSNDHSNDNSIITADVIDALRINYND